VWQCLFIASLLVFWVAAPAVLVVLAVRHSTL
jgi:hypothetical protein